MKGFVQIVEALIIAVVLVLLYQWVKAAGEGLLKIPNPFDGLTSWLNGLWPKTGPTEHEPPADGSWEKQPGGDYQRTTPNGDRQSYGEWGDSTNDKKETVNGGDGSGGGGGGHPFAR